MNISILKDNGDFDILEWNGEKNKKNINVLIELLQIKNVCKKGVSTAKWFNDKKQLIMVAKHTFNPWEK